MKKYLLVIITVLSLSLMLGSCGNDTENNKEEFSEISSICELATLKCYYHNTSEIDVKPTGFLNSVLGNLGFKRAWFEYSGIVKVGIDASQVEIIPPEEGSNIVKVKLPEAKILSITFDSDSISEPITETGWFTEITAEELTQAQGNAQKEMKEKAEGEESLKKQALDRAKELIKKYVQNTGKLMDIEYTVEWIKE